MLLNDEQDQDEYQEETPEEKAKRLLDLEAFSKIIKGMRSDAISGRSASGIETEWQEDDDHYEGRDGVNAGSVVAKPRVLDGAFEVRYDSFDARSTVFLKITRPYVDAAAARVADMLLPTDDRNWALRPTPVPELIKGRYDPTGVVDAGGQPVMMPAPTEAPQPGAPMGQSARPGMLSRMAGAVSDMFGGGQPQPPAAPPMKQMTAGDQAKAAIEKAKESSELAQEEIDDWLVECRYHAEVRKVIESAARIGTGILKGPFPRKKKSRAAEKTLEGWTLSIKEKTNPVSISIDPRNFYPDPNCGEDIQDGSFCFERGDITARKLRNLKGTQDSGYIDEVIDQCLEEGPVNAVTGVRSLKRDQKVRDQDLFEIWHFYGEVSRKDMLAAGCECGDDMDSYPCEVTMVNDHVIKITQSPLNGGEFPFDVMVWQTRLDSWAGVGVARQMRECQKGANAAVRNLMDNAGLSAGPQIIVDRDKIVPANGRWELRPRKIWWKKKDGEEIDNVRNAFVIVNIQTLQADLMALLQFWLKEAEDVTGLPMLIQGQQGKAPETVGGMTMLNNNATSVLRRIARIFDDKITEPHIGRYYEWLMLAGPEDAKGDFQIDARGSSALIERDLQNQALMQLVGLSVNPAYGLDPENVIKEVLKGMRLDPKRLELSDEKKQEMASRPPPEDPRVTAAKIMAESRGKDLQTKAESDASLLSMKIDAEKAAQEIEVRLAMDGTTSEEKRELDKIKADLAVVTMKLQVQERLSVAGNDTHRRTALAGHMTDLYKHGNPQVITPAAEPAGRAQDGAAFTQ